LTQFRVQVTALTSGTVTGAITCSSAGSGSGVASSNGVVPTTPGGLTNATIAAGTAGPQAIKASAGRLVSVLITTAGSTSETFYDNPSACSGTIIGVTPAITSLGQTYVFNNPGVTGITACGTVTTSPGLTVNYN
jgi:hypothetical protein